MFIVKYKKIFVSISTVLVLAAIVLFFVRGLNIGIDFTGGSLLEVEYSQNVPTLENMQGLVPEAESVRQVGDSGFSIRTKFLSDEERNSLTQKLSAQNESLTVKRFSSVGPSVGQELRNKSILAIVIVLIAT